MTKAEQIKNYMEKLGLTEEEATQLYLDDKADTIGEEGEQLERKAAAIPHREKSATPRKQAVRERKVNETKGFILDEVREVLEKIGAEKIQTFTETEIDFAYDGNNYTLKLSQHRANWQRKQK